MDKNISLEVLNLGHAEELYALTQCNRSYLREWLPWLDQTTCVNDTAAFIGATEKHPFGPHFAIFFEGVMCGVAGYYSLNRPNRVGSIGFWLSKSHVGKGIMTAVVKELAVLGFKECGLNRIEIRCAEYNLKSRAIPERLGFMYEGTLRECEWLYSRFVNHAVYSLLKSDSHA